MSSSEEELKMRSMCCELNLLTQSDASAMLCEGKTTLLVSVYGPVEVKQQKLQIEKATVETNYKPAFGQSGVADRFVETFVRNVFEVTLYTNLYPRTAISIFIQEMYDDGGKLSCAVNACALALMNSGLAMRFLVAAVTCTLDKDKKYSIDCSKQFSDPVATFTFVFDNINYNIVASSTSGSFTDDEYNEAIHYSKAASKEIFTFYRNIVKKYSQKIGKRSDL